MAQSKTPIGRLNKLQQTCVQLNEMAYRLGPGEKFPTALQLCDTLKVSPVTLNSALRELEESDVIYRRHAVGIFVSPNLRRSISLLCSPSFFTQGDVADFWGLMLDVATEHAQHQNAGLRCDFTMPTQKPIPLSNSLQHDLLSGEVHGVIGIALGLDIANWISTQGIPLVTYATDSAHTVNFDASEIVSTGVRTLVEQGCRNIHFWTPRMFPEQSAPDPTTKNEFEQALLYHDVKGQMEPVTPDMSNDDVAGRSRETHQGIELAQKVFTRPRAQWPDGLLIGDDTMTRGALLALQRMGIEVNRDLKIATHSNRGSAVLHGYEEDLTRIEFDARELVESLYQMLECLINKEDVPEPRISIKPQVHLPKISSVLVAS